MGRLALRLAGREDWEDVLQDSLSAAWRRRRSFDADRGTARNWLLAIVADQARGRRSKHVILQLGADDPEPETGSTNQSAATRIDLENAIARLSSRQRMAIEFHYFLDLSVEDTAEIMRCSSGTVKSTLSDARKRMREYLAGYNED